MVSDMNSAPLVSIVIPLYNAENYIEETLISVKQQTYSNIEVIVIDNASNDNSLSIVDKFKSNFCSFKLLSCEQNSGGPAKPRNLGLEAATGDYIAFLDSDDVWSPSKIESQVNIMEAGGLNFTCTDSRLIDGSSKLISNKLRTFFASKNSHYGVRSLMYRSSITTSSVMVKSDFIQGFRFDESARITCVEDYLLWLTLLNSTKCRFQHIKEDLVDYRQLSSSASHSKGFRLQFAKSNMAACRFMVDQRREDLLLTLLFSNFIKVFLFSLLKK